MIEVRPAIRRLPTHSETARLERWRMSTFWVMLLGYVGYYLCRKNLSAALPLLETEFGYNNAQLGLIGASSEIAYAAGKFINGPLGDKVGGKNIFLLGMAGAIVFNLIFASSATLTAFIVVWCLCRFFLSMGWGGIVKTIGSWYEPERNGTIMGWISINFQFGGVAATLFAGWLVREKFGWQAIFIAPAAVVSLMWIWAALASKGKPQDLYPGVIYPPKGEKTSLLDAESKTNDDEDIGIRESFKILFKVPVFRHLVFFSFLTTLLRSTFTFWTAKFLLDVLKMKQENAIFNSALFPLLGCIGTVLLGWYTDRYAKDGDRARVMWIMLLCLAACIFGMAFLVPYEQIYSNAFVGLMALSGFFLLGPYSMPSGCLTLDVAGKRAAASCAGILDGVGYLGGALSTYAAGQLSVIGGWSVVFYCMGFVALGATWSAWGMSREFRRAAKKRGYVEDSGPSKTKYTHFTDYHDGKTV